jgi:hypothetical protein
MGRAAVCPETNCGYIKKGEPTGSPLQRWFKTMTANESVVNPLRIALFHMVKAELLNSQ